MGGRVSIPFHSPSYSIIKIVFQPEQDENLGSSVVELIGKIIRVSHLQYHAEFIKHNTNVGGGD
jgi:hypothetical protein